MERLKKLEKRKKEQKRNIKIHNIKQKYNKAPPNTKNKKKKKEKDNCIQMQYMRDVKYVKFNNISSTKNCKTLIDDDAENQFPEGGHNKKFEFHTKHELTDVLDNKFDGNKMLTQELLNFLPKQIWVSKTKYHSKCFCGECVTNFIVGDRKKNRTICWTKTLDSDFLSEHFFHFDKQLISIFDSFESHSNWTILIFEKSDEIYIFTTKYDDMLLQKVSKPEFLQFLLPLNGELLPKVCQEFMKKIFGTVDEQIDENPMKMFSKNAEMVFFTKFALETYCIGSDLNIKKMSNIAPFDVVQYLIRSKNENW